MYFLVGGFNPIEKQSQNGNLPQLGMKRTHIKNHYLAFKLLYDIFFDQ